MVRTWPGHKVFIFSIHKSANSAMHILYRLCSTFYKRHRSTENAEHIYLLAMIFKHQRRVNTAMPLNTAMTTNTAMPTKFYCANVPDQWCDSKSSYFT